MRVKALVLVIISLFRRRLVPHIASNGVLFVINLDHLKLQIYNYNDCSIRLKVVLMLIDRFLGGLRE